MWYVDSYYAITCNTPIPLISALFYKVLTWKSTKKGFPFNFVNDIKNLFLSVKKSYNFRQLKLDTSDRKVLKKSGFFIDKTSLIQFYFLMISAV